LKIRTGVLAAFAAPCLPVAAIGLPVVVHLPPYYAGTLGLDLATVGLLFLIVRLVDVPLDPFIGHLVDGTRGRFGRFRPWVAGGSLIIMAGIYLVFMAPPGLSAGRAFFGLLVMYLGYSACLVAHTAWGAVLSDDYHERSRVFGWWQAANLLGLLLILFVPPAAQYLAGRNDPAIGVHAMGWIVLGVLPLAVLWALLVVPERQRLGTSHPTLGDIVAVAKLPLLRRLLLVDLLANLAPGLAGALLLFFFEAARGYTSAQASLLLVFYFAAGMLAAPLWIRIARRTSKHGAMAAALIGYALTLTGTLVIPSNSFALAAIGLAIAGVPAVAPAFLLRAMLADLSDATTLESGRERTGLFYAALAAVQKLGYAIPVGISYPVLQAIGFDAKLGTGNSEAAIAGLTFMFIVPPVVLALAAAAVVRGWPISAEAHARTARALTA